jgi:hypothetical protein
MKVTINTTYMHNYRILSLGTMQNLSAAQSELIKLANKKNDQELQDLMWQFANVIRSIDWADKFLFVHGQPTKHQAEHTRHCKQVRKQISHQPLAHH